MKFTLITCALGAAGLTPALHGALGGQQDPAAPALAPAPVAPVATISAQSQPAQPPQPVAVGTATLAAPKLPVVAGVPLALGASAPPSNRLFVAGLRSQEDDLARDADRLKEEIDRLRAELEAVRSKLNSEEAGRSRGRGSRRSEAREGREARETVEGRARRLIEVREERRAEAGAKQRERAMKQRERAMVLREQAEERREEAEVRRAEALERAEEMRAHAMEHAAEAQERAMEIAERAAEEGRALSVESLHRYVEGHEAHDHDGEEHEVFVFESDGGKTFKIKVDGDYEMNEERIIVKGRDGGSGGIFVFESDGEDDPVVEFKGSTENFFGPAKGGKVVPGKKIVTGKNIFSAKTVAPGKAAGALQWTTGGKIDAGGPNTFNIHVEDGDVHIHAHGSSSFNTGKTSKSGGQGGTVKGLFGQAKPGQKGQAHRLFARVQSEDGKPPVFGLKVNGKDIDVDSIEEMIAGIDGMGIEMSIAEALGDLEGLAEVNIVEGLADLKSLKGLEGLEGLAEIKVMGLEDLGDLEGLLEGMDIDIDMDFEFEEECEEEVIEEEVEVEESRAATRERFVKTPFQGDGVWMPASFHWSEKKPGEWAQAAHDFASVQSQWQNLATANGLPLPPQSGARFPGEALGANQGEQLLDLARQIQQDVAEMRAELKELRAEVLAAEPRARRRR